jgi:hypothetical protein
MDAPHFEGEVRDSLRRKWPLWADGIKVPKGGRCSVFTGNRRVRDESYRSWSGYPKTGVSAALCRGVIDPVVFFETESLS